MWYDTTLRDDNITEELVQPRQKKAVMRTCGTKDKVCYGLFIIADSELQVTGNNTLLLVITSSVTCEFENFCGKVLQDGSEVYLK